ncbi:hypothetical protein BJX62DRAFT_238061 [Aspergillus germanicus]
MKVTTLLYTILAAATVGAAASVPVLEARDTCGPGYAGDQRRTNSPCQASNGDRSSAGAVDGQRSRIAAVPHAAAATTAVPDARSLPAVNSKHSISTDRWSDWSAGQVIK